MAGGCIVERVDENLTYDYLHASEDNLWSTLYLTGYGHACRHSSHIAVSYTHLTLPTT